MSVPVLRTKPGTKFDRIAPGGFRILAALDRACHVLGRDLTIAAGTNDHITGRHPLGEAFDVSVLGLTVGQIVQLKSMLTAKLGPHFTVLYETRLAPNEPALQAIAFVNANASGPHFHLQVKKGTEYPPVDPPDKVQVLKV